MAEVVDLLGMAFTRSALGISSADGCDGLHPTVGNVPRIYPRRCAMFSGAAHDSKTSSGLARPSHGVTRFLVV